MPEIFSPERLTLGRQRRGLKKQELASRLEVAPKTIGRWERGDSVPDEAAIQALAEVLGFPVPYFSGDAPPLLEDFAFRSLARMTARQRDTALAAGAQAVALDLWLDERILRPDVDIPDLRGFKPADAAFEVRVAWNLGFRPIPNFVHLLESKGVRVYSLVHDGVAFDAFSVWYGGTPFVFLNTAVTAERSRMDAGHELGHLVLHAKTGGGATKPENDQANEFASCLLMPRDEFLATAPRKVALGSVIHAKQRWGVSALSYVRRLHTLGRISDWHYRSMCIEIKTKFRVTEPGPTRPNEASKVLAWAFSSQESGLTRRAAADHLRIPLSDLAEVTFGLALTPIEGGGIRSHSSGHRPELKLVD